ncbi:unnamed protein product [Prorocentrum cordatum]|uniref:Uncharacterized protein n=1 Tax=Prorocentrum cordatum TaxID=2364126 RepID=A0ABN9REK6_9DINO|nr:unnamed protein product [Polarella glacialis]
MSLYRYCAARQLLQRHHGSQPPAAAAAEASGSAAEASEVKPSRGAEAAAPASEARPPAESEAAEAKPKAQAAAASAAIQAARATLDARFDYNHGQGRGYGAADIYNGEHELLRRWIANPEPEGEPPPTGRLRGAAEPEARGCKGVEWRFLSVNSNTWSSFQDVCEWQLAQGGLQSIFHMVQGLWGHPESDKFWSSLDGYFKGISNLDTRWSEAECAARFGLTPDQLAEEADRFRGEDEESKESRTSASTMRLREELAQAVQEEIAKAILPLQDRINSEREARQRAEALLTSAPRHVAAECSWQRLKGRPPCAPCEGCPMHKRCGAGVRGEL